MSSEHVEVLERLRGVLEHGKMGDKCLIAPDLVEKVIASLSAPQPPAEAQPVAHYCEHRQKCKWHGDGPWPSFGTGEGGPQAWKDAHTERCGGRILSLYAAPPSAPVGVASAAAAVMAVPELQDMACIGSMSPAEHALGLLQQAFAQQPAADSRICRVCDGGPGNDGSCLCGHRKWERGTDE